jgi:hypothetical protein
MEMEHYRAMGCLKPWWSTSTCSWWLCGAHQSRPIGHRPLGATRQLAPLKQWFSTLGTPWAQWRPPSFWGTADLWRKMTSLHPWRRVWWGQLGTTFPLILRVRNQHFVVPPHQPAAPTQWSVADSVEVRLTREQAPGCSGSSCRWGWD